MSSARVEATNNKIKLIVRRAYGFRNIQKHDGYGISRML
ncbi:MAG: hypothetical protein DUD39_15885 [Coriobacteriaceae bacterium]|nr:MAG: hypothetical protein DUD39_15885 [Coriobacteriaceae bacterium]